MRDERTFFAGDDCSPEAVEACDAGQLVKWRVAADGVQWYRRVSGAPAEHPDIMAVPPSADAAVDAGDDDDIDADNVELIDDAIQEGGTDEFID